MKAKTKHLKENDLTKAYITQINWDWLFFKGQFIFGILFLMGLVAFILWFAR